ncbi:ceramidase domain-containing protein [Epibacterium sp. Ofav1-8]|uniref:ceramidase domain-containing protein n=1 Tax=Epibacterium sp. Ofav1-8 TaxID=2917735 RepID=UPI001EF5EF51|nr:ceramidase domain-containing protein [Epibacterium sp. Ofav1-8]MCG7623046.1 ceramidase [Epibacterium sp. Ofav1-8]
MDLTQEIDAYCERLGPGLWAEPLNAVTNLAFVIVAGIMWQRAGGAGQGRVMARVLCLLMAAIGIGSGLFHTVAQAWAALADVLPIALFILTYLFAVHRDVLRLRPVWAFGATAMFLPYAAMTGSVFAQVSWIGGSAGYAPVPLLILIYGIALRRRLPAVSRGFLVGAGLLILSLVFRTTDLPVCGAFPSGTHFFWHLLNAAMLGWMIEVYLRHQRAQA